jgi:hypothetical protein
MLPFFYPKLFLGIKHRTQNLIHVFSPAKMRTQMVHTKFGSHEEQDTETNMEVDSRCRNVVGPLEMV